MKNEFNTVAMGAPTLNMAVIPHEFLVGLLDEVKEVKSILQQKNNDDFNSQWIESAKAREILGVSQKTWQNYRDERRIPFSQFGRKIYVRRADLDAFMELHYISARQ